MQTAAQKQNPIVTSEDYINSLRGRKLKVDFRSEEVGGLLEKYLKGRADVSTENRMRILRLIENMTLGRNAVGYLTESMHGAGSPQAQRIQIARQMQIEFKKTLAKELAGIEERKREQLSSEIADYFGKVFDTEV